MSALSIRVDDLRGVEIVALLEEHLRDMHAVTPAESVHALDLDGLRRPNVTFWTAWDGTELVGCGALKRLDDAHAEIKSMRTTRAARGRGVASAVLAHILTEASRMGFGQVNLETGSGEFFAPARALYEKFGFVACGPFEDYTDDPNSSYYTMALRAGPDRMTIRNETPADIDAITDVTTEAFKAPPYSSHTEQLIVLALRAAGALTISLVAELEGRVVGHIAFSPVSISDGSAGWFGLGPVSVVPELQREGIGSALVNEGLGRLRALHAKGCFLVGNAAYYGRFGFRNGVGLVYGDAPAEVSLALALDGPIPQGTVTFHEAFHATAP